MRSILTFGSRFLGAFIFVLALAATVAPEAATAATHAVHAFLPGVPLGDIGLGGVLMASVAPFAIDKDLVATSIAYKNRSLIADSVLPRVPVNKQEYKYYEWNKDEPFTVPDTKVGRTSAPNQVEFTATEQTGSCRWYALDDPIPQDDIDNAPEGMDPMGRATEGLTDLIGLDREVRVAGKVFDAATYAAANKVALAGGSQWSDPASTPLTAIMTALDIPIMRPNVLLLGQAVWTKLRMNPEVVEAVLGTGAAKGVVTREALAAVLEIEEILVGQSFVNNAKKGQQASMSRTWGKHALLFYRDRLADPTTSAARITFGITPQWGSRVAGKIADANIGVRGGQKVRVGEAVDEKIVDAAVAYFFQNAVA